jgi:hypothetical protein
MILCRETVKMMVPARHCEPARSGEAGGPSREIAGSESRRGVQSWNIRANASAIELLQRHGAIYRSYVAKATVNSQSAKRQAQSAKYIDPPFP